MERSDRYVHFSEMRVGTSGQKNKYVNLFTHPFYYLQNEIEDIEVRNRVKALLFLHTLTFFYPTCDKKDNVAIKSFFNHNFYSRSSSSYSDSCISGIENVPYGYLLLLGGLYWRSQLEQDPIIYSSKDVCSYKKPNNKDNPLFAPVEADGIKYPVFIVSETAHYYDQDFTCFYNICAIANDVHTTAIPKLIKFFENFVNNDWPKIRNCCELMITKKKDNNEQQFILTVRQFIYIKNKLANSAYVNNMEKTLGLLNGDELTEIVKDGEKVYRIDNFKENYVMAFVKDGQLYSYYSETSPFQNIFRDLMFKEVIVTTISNCYNEASSYVYGLGCPLSYYYEFFEGYGQVIENYIKDESQPLDTFEDDKLGLDTNIDIVDDEEGYDFRCELYMSLKNIWDRWLCGYYNMGTTTINGRKINGKKIFHVKNFFDNNFVFIDSFYNNIHNTLKLNCTKLLELYTGQGNDGKKLGTTTVTHLGSVASEHMCHMFNFPDSVNFAEVDENGKPKDVNMLDNMKQVFTPLGVGKMADYEPEYSNKFTIIYTHSANKLDTNDRNSFVSDTFDIWSYQDGTEVAPAPFKSKNQLDDIDLLTDGAAIGYKVPAFGVAYSRQNNSIWKNVNVGMENFTVTEQSIKALDYIVSKGNSEAHNVTFYGQDIYSLYQSYSYTVTVEMMGDLQIQPLMYFQLMNVPMFRGTYMIFKVEHNITVGNITTVFTGMKMSKVQTPYTKNWFKVSDDDSFVDPNMDESNDGGEKIPTNNGEIDLADNNLSAAVNSLINQDLYCDDFVIQVYDGLGVKINNLL